MAKILTKLQNWLLAILVFVIPANLFYKISEQSAYVDGLLVDYLIPKIYLQDLLILLLLVVALVKLIAQKKLNKFCQKIIDVVKKHRLLLIIILLFFFRQFFTANYIAAIWFFLKLALLAIFFLWLKSSYFIKKNKYIFWALVSSLIFQALLAGYQLIAQKQLFGYLFLGEPNLQQSFALAEGSLGGNLITL
ncbi:MAG: hypothetical protein U9O78_04135, partial [Patescibacteria group bacterium]|nr:hypothetical protein [Patescibacteria group bacterium]